MGLFGWLAAGPLLAAYDLRRHGWRLLRGSLPAPQEPYALLVRRDGLAFSDWLELTGGPQDRRAATVMIEVADPGERARLIRLGFGDALAPGTTLDEIEARARRVLDSSERIPRTRAQGALWLDLMARDAMVASRPLGLHPREFALLWRLAEEPGRALSPRQLISEVWRLSFRPETNSLAVHVSRLRAKLRVAGLEGLIETTPEGWYRLAAPIEPERNRLDEPAHLREDFGDDPARHPGGAASEGARDVQPDEFH